MALARPGKNTPIPYRVRGEFVPHIARESDDLLYDLQEVMEGWVVSYRQIARKIKNGELRRVRRPGYQPYYPHSSVVSAFGDPVKPITPRYQRGFDLGIAA